MSEKRIDILERREEVLKWIELGETKTSIAKKLNCRGLTLNRYLNKMGIEYAGRPGFGPSQERKSAMSYIENDLPIKSYALKNKMFEDGIKEKICERCNGIKWLKKPIPLELHHVDGNPYNNKLDNLEILCPNCHAQTESFCRRKDAQINKCVDCGKKVSNNRHTRCRPCSGKFRRNKNCKIDWPTVEKLMEMIEGSSYCAVGRKLGVSDNAVRKHIERCKTDCPLESARNSIS